jgi:hypothetical protein
MGRTILHRPLWIFVLAILTLVGLVIIILNLLFWLICFLLKYSINLDFLLIFDSGLYVTLTFFVIHYLWKHFVNVEPSLSFLNQYDDGPWLHWIADPKTSMVINWITRNETPTALDFGEDIKNLRNITGPKGKIHHLSLTELTPNTTYYYRIKDFSKDPSINSFQTAPTDPRPFAFTVVGDTQNGGGLGLPDWAYPFLAQNMATKDFDLFMHVGDACEQGNDVRSWHAFLDASRDVLKNHPMHIAIGNHDTGTNYMKDKLVKKYPDEGANFDYLLDYHYKRPLEENEMTSFKGRYFSFYYSNCLFLFLDTQNSKLAEPLNPQWHFIQKELEQCPPNYWKIVFIHRPLIYMSRKPDGSNYYDRENFAKYVIPLLEQYGVDIVFQGHRHDYEVYQPPWKENVNDISESPWFFISGGGADDMKSERKINFDIDLPGFYMGIVTPHFLWVQIEEDICTIQAIDFQDNVIDTRNIHRFSNIT